MDIINAATVINGDIRLVLKWRFCENAFSACRLGVVHDADMLAELLQGASLPHLAVVLTSEKSIAA